jgi:peptidoglycan/xylan/chitin deacetylase (PgdA/CDA1 family)
MLTADSDKPPIAISLNFDSLNEAYGFPPGYRDPSFFYVFDRLTTMCAKDGVPLSIYIVGKDLENPEHAARVRDWADWGHEIGNHSWSHHFNMASLSTSELEQEIVRAHAKITDCIGREPKGFIAPAWATSGAMIGKLLDLGYEYDTSAFPSVLLFPMIAKVAVNHWRAPSKGLRMLFRKDWHGPFFFPNEPFYLDSHFRIHRNAEPGALLVLPLPARTRFTPAIWHTLGFMVGWGPVFKGVRGLAGRVGFYYLIHPADFLSPDDLDPRYRQSLARMNVPLDQKLALLEDAFTTLRALGRPFGTMADVARDFHTRRGNGHPSTTRSQEN